MNHTAVSLLVLASIVTYGVLLLVVLWAMSFAYSAKPPQDEDTKERHDSPT